MCSRGGGLFMMIMTDDNMMTISGFCFFSLFFFILLICSYYCSISLNLRGMFLAADTVRHRHLVEWLEGYCCCRTSSEAKEKQEKAHCNFNKLCCCRGYHMIPPPLAWLSQLLRAPASRWENVLIICDYLTLTNALSGEHGHFASV